MAEKRVVNTEAINGKPAKFWLQPAISGPEILAWVEEPATTDQLEFEERKLLIDTAIKVWRMVKQEELNKTAKDLGILRRRQQPWPPGRWE